MAIKIYVDVLFIINFILDFSLLVVCSLFLKQKVTYFRLTLSGSLGGLFAVFAFFYRVPFYFSCLIPCAMIFICFNKKNVRFLIKATAVFYLTSACFAGFGFLALFSGKINMLFGSGYFYAQINAYTLLFVFLVTVFVVRLSFGFVKREKIKSDFLYEVTIEKNKKSVTAKALFDTGNFLRDPILQNGVIISEWSTVKGLFSEKSLALCVKSHPDDFFTVPFKDASGKDELFAFLPDRVSVDKNSEIPAHPIGVLDSRLDKDETFKMILPNDFFLKEGI